MKYLELRLNLPGLCVLENHPLNLVHIGVVAEENENADRGTDDDEPMVLS